jgi:hypothetical protein
MALLNQVPYLTTTINCGIINYFAVFDFMVDSLVADIFE